MPITVPAETKISTTVYDNFKGVDFTNDATNVWRRRSPSGVNMLPDESGRPFKRHGWNILLSNSDLSAALGVESCKINKCAYFELAGVDHIVVFTDSGVAFYIDTPDFTGFTATNLDYDCYTGFDRSFFFEGNGMAAFYIYGNFKVWRYSYNNGFVLEEVTDQVTIPRVMIAADATGTGTVYESYNLLGRKAYIEYNSIDLWDYWCSDGLTVAVDKETFISGKTQGGHYEYTYDGSDWSPSLTGTGIEVQGEAKADDKIIVVWAWGVMLPNNVTQNQIADVQAWGSMKTQFDFPIEVENKNTTNPNWKAKLYDDPLGKRAWIEFNEDLSLTWLVGGEDFLRVQFPSVKIDITNYPIENPETGQHGGAEDCRDNGYARLIGLGA